jgi:hypothetical protein
MNTDWPSLSGSIATRPRSRPYPHFLVGRNNQGQWVVRDRESGHGRIFNNRQEALCFAFKERGNAPGAVVLVPDVLEFFAGADNGEPVDGSEQPRPMIGSLEKA